MMWSFDATKSNALELRPFVGDCFPSISAKIWCPIDPLPLGSDGLAALPLPRVSHFFKSKIHYSCNYGTWPSWSISFLFSYIVAAIATGTYRGRTDKTTMLRSDLTSSGEKWMTFKMKLLLGNISNLGHLAGPSNRDMLLNHVWN